MVTKMKIETKISKNNNFEPGKRKATKANFTPNRTSNT